MDYKLFFSKGNDNLNIKYNTNSNIDYFKLNNAKYIQNKEEPKVITKYVELIENMLTFKVSYLQYNDSVVNLSKRLTESSSKQHLSNNNSNSKKEDNLLSISFNNNNPIVYKRDRFLSENNCNPSYQIKNYQHLILQDDYFSTSNSANKIDTNEELMKSLKMNSFFNKRKCGTEPKFNLDLIDEFKHHKALSNVCNKLGKMNLNSQFDLIKESKESKESKKSDNSRKSTDTKSHVKDNSNKKILKNRRGKERLNKKDKLSFLPQEENSDGSFEFYYDCGEDENYDDIFHIEKKDSIINITSDSKLESNNKNFDLSSILKKANELKEALITSENSTINNK